ncbi:MAG: tRNA lysidine(34) synthetase TilS [Deltaproteobacteria bacterium RIFCSPLOWO2_12_FULL_44_12]|nr:MAG: tRNA lysidine(34) synthetase TilS [Deltaproteobacteria bacterium RIFCSPHIGHO2_01_FULL_43_49]OGQ15727.1 MAG: tRNA lysidine(34) synthetase TilS [Deltaproteobacteria bacterium RIFCSPHIGHO2_02_FULL_44_53]OGQ28696.1 MAG: tRNA lysidine(34) synthetase TilS [Deltaproteobacteria bacterium RIFCSPHIGHO2_12_FULL_44_21]OGQ32019.1 MAG: tRNA lysidine(34) synthetase TilS [Deltaproteobacteria bacterium RIFCSPLOWO2_01_FULL_45_74]OGQ43632.1 MAG: tRNA lysidine(34) synthetase TilS [Deltaproteobacteria bacte
MFDLYKKFRATILRQHLISPLDSVLVGVSGGVDSMVLASLLLQLRKDIEFGLNIAHVNYGLRGKESDDQENLVCQFAKKNKLPFFVTKAVLPKTFQNFQALAREFRYHYFTETALQVGANKVAVAHHMEDQVETILAQWLRGASLKGLAGMSSSREIQKLNIKNQNDKSKCKIVLIRPLLAFRKEEIQAYSKEHHVLYLEDSSNATDLYWRNRLRHELLPVIQKLRPKAFDKIVKLGEELKELNDYLAGQAAQWLGEFGKQAENGIWLPRPRLAKLPKTLRLEIFYQTILSQKGSATNLKRDHLAKCDQVSLGEKQEGSYPLPQGLKFVRVKDDLYIKEW